MTDTRLSCEVRLSLAAAQDAVVARELVVGA